MSSGGGGSSSGKTTVRYADYIESHHSAFLDSVQENRLALIELPSPYADYTAVEVDDAFFGAGYLISSFPSLYDMYGKFMAGLDIEVLWSQTFEDTVNSSVVADLISAEAALMDDDIDANSIPRMEIGIRDMGYALSSTFAIGRAIIEDTRTKVLNKYAAELRYKLIPVAQDRWQAHLNWNKLVVATYAEIMKLYYSAKSDIDEVNYAMIAKDKLWPFTILDFERAALGALQGATNTKTDVAGASTTARVLGGAMSGAAMGAMIGSNWNTPAVAATSTSAATTASYAGSGWGAGIGAVLGAGAALTY